MIALTHVCQAWREVFVSRASLWTDLHCKKLNADKVRVYLERSKSSPISLQLDEAGDLSPHHPFLHIVPHAIGRLKFLDVEGTPGNLQDITARLCRPAPLLEYLWINGDCTVELTRNPALTTALFDGDLASLRELHLQAVRTELPWRNMVNLTSFSLRYTSPGDVPIRHLLNFLESAPHLRKIKFRRVPLTSDSQDGRLVSLARLNRMDIIGDDPPSLLLNHLIIPVGAELNTRTSLHGPLIEDHLPRSLGNLRNLLDFADIQLRIGERFSRIRLSGPNGRVTMFPRTSRIDATYLVLDSLAQLDISGAKHLKIDRGNSPLSNPFYRVLLSMKHLRALTLSRCRNLDVFINLLGPSASSSGIVVCPKLEELVLVLRLDGKTFNMENVIGMAEARASRGMKLKAVRIVSHDESVHVDALELMEHVLRVECGPEVDAADEDGDGSYEEDSDGSYEED